MIYRSKKSKTKSPKQLAKTTAWKWFSKFIRLRDCIVTMNSLEYGKCITCGAIKEMSSIGDCLQAGHALGGRGGSILFDEKLVHAQCVKCNKWLNGNYNVYYEKLENMFYAGFMVEKIKLANTIVYYTVENYREIAKKYRIKYNRTVKNFTNKSESY